MIDQGGVGSGARVVQLDTGRFDVVAASVAGLRSQIRKKPCEDYCLAEGGQDWIVAIASDGAGCATRALDGARIVSEEVCRSVARCLINAGQYKELLTGSIKAAVREGIERARSTCIAEAKDGDSLRAFDATVVGAAMAHSDGILFHIGDGGASAYSETPNGIQTLGFSEPENGDYINETFFFTEEYWNDHLRFTEINGTPDAVWLMTDGAYPLMVRRKEKHLNASTAREIDRLVFGPSATSRSKMLAAILMGQEAAENNDDDKTLVILKRRA